MRSVFMCRKVSVRMNLHELIRHIAGYTNLYLLPRCFDFIRCTHSAQHDTAWNFPFITDFGSVVWCHSERSRRISMNWYGISQDIEICIYHKRFFDSVRCTHSAQHDTAWDFPFLTNFYISSRFNLFSLFCSRFLLTTFLPFCKINK